MKPTPTPRMMLVGKNTWNINFEIQGTRTEVTREIERMLATTNLYEEMVEEVAESLLTRTDFWDAIEVKPGEYDNLVEALAKVKEPNP